MKCVALKNKPNYNETYIFPFHSFCHAKHSCSNTKASTQPKSQVSTDCWPFGGYYRLCKAICSRANDFWRFGSL